MASNVFRAGVADILLPVDSATAVPSMNGIAFTASGYTIDQKTYNSIQTPIDTTKQYQIALALGGRDASGQGFATAPSTASSGLITLTTGQCIKVKLPVANWPANFSVAAFLEVYIAAGSSTSFQLAKVVPIYDAVVTQTDLEFFVFMAPITAAEQFLLSTLVGATNPLSQKALGTTRAPLGFTWTSVNPTTNDVVMTFEQGGQITFTPNNSSDFTVITARPLSVTFSALVNDEQTITQATAGDWMQATDGGIIYQEAEWGMQTAQVIVPGNRPLLMHLPPNSSLGNAQTLILFTGLLLQNQTQVQMAWSKRNETPVPFNFQPAPLDAKFTNRPTVYTRIQH